MYPEEDPEYVVLGGLEELGYCAVTEEALGVQGGNPGVVAIEIAERHGLRLESWEIQATKVYEFTRIE
jgi:hypothetical protein